MRLVIATTLFLAAIQVQAAPEWRRQHDAEREALMAEARKHGKTPLAVKPEERSKPDRPATEEKRERPDESRRTFNHEQHENRGHGQQSHHRDRDRRDEHWNHKGDKSHHGERYTKQQHHHNGNVVSINPGRITIHRKDRHWGEHPNRSHYRDQYRWLTLAEFRTHRGRETNRTVDINDEVRGIELEGRKRDMSVERAYVVYGNGYTERLYEFEGYLDDGEFRSIRFRHPRYVRRVELELEPQGFQRAYARLNLLM